MSQHQRAAGILLHITSLPSKFGIGDLGPEAYAFARFLHESKQSYWQLLPINPTEQGQGHSPYSSISSRAGNTLFISPEQLVRDGLLAHADIQPHELPTTSKVDYKAAEDAKAAMFELAFNNFKSGQNDNLKSEYEAFSRKEHYWLHDFALYTLLKKQHDGQPWFNWQEHFKLRDQEALDQLQRECAEEIDKIKWLQFIFTRQWHELRSECNKLNIKLFGDMPFYVSYDSVDVWANRHLFSLDEEGNTIGMSGVPPDAFSDDGQLWGMPVFLWHKVKEEKYAWWIERFKKNIEFFDLLRLDHFRAFADYWEVPASETTARSGAWKPGPGADLFDAVEAALGKLPFIAEDLGEINEPVYELRDRFQFPGMKILQFAFGHEMPKSPYIPHNYSENFIAYTGTHDNNTILGWYRQEARQHHQQINEYVGREVNEQSVNDIFCRIALSSVAFIAVLPIQDLLNLNEEARMNTPSKGDNNWQWRLQPGMLNQDVRNRLAFWTYLYNRSVQ